MHGAADILHGAAISHRSLASILSVLPDILQVQHQFFEMFLSVLGFSMGKIHFFSKVPKNWSSCQKPDYHFLGGSGPKVIKITFLNPSLTMNHFEKNTFLKLPNKGIV